MSSSSRRSSVGSPSVCATSSTSKVGEQLPGPVQHLPHPQGRHRFTEPGTELGGHLPGRQVRVVRTQPEHGVGRRSARGLGLGQSMPGLRQQLIAPARQEDGVEVRARRCLVGRLGVLGVQRPGLPLTLLAVIADQMDEGRFHVVAEAAAPRVGVVVVAIEEAEGEFLEQFLRGGRVAERRRQVAADCAAVKLQQPMLRRPGRLVPAVVRQGDDRPEGRDVAESLVRELADHDHGPEFVCRETGSHGSRITGDAHRSFLSSDAH